MREQDTAKERGREGERVSKSEQETEDGGRDKTERERDIDTERARETESEREGERETQREGKEADVRARLFVCKR